MKHVALAALAIGMSLGIGTATYAQFRHDEKPHGSAKPAATQGEVQRGMPGRHDERPHGPPKKKDAAKKSADAEKK